MKVALFSPPGLFADCLRYVLAKLASQVAVERFDPDADDVLCSDCDLALVDLDAVHRRKPAAAITRVLEQLPRTPVVAIATRTDAPALAEVMQAGAAGYIAKGFDAEQALGVLRVVLEDAGATSARDAVLEPAADGVTATPLPVGHNGHPCGLTHRELEALALLVTGMGNKAMGACLGITEGVVKLHLHHAYQKLGVRTRLQAVAIAQQIEAIRKVQIDRASDIGSLRHWLLPHMASEVRRAGEVIFRKGEPGRALYFVQEGRIRLTELDKTIGEGELLGEIGIFTPDNKRTCSARCESEVRLLSLSAERAQSLFFANPQFAYYVTRLISQRLLSDRTGAAQSG